MVNQVAIIVTIAIMISLFGVIFQAQSASGRRVHFIVIPAGSNTTSTSNMTGSNTTGSNTTLGTHDSSVHTTNPAAYSTHDSRPSIRNVK
jgi:type IV pilus biogenesis protein CpaD/CtpE